VQSGVGVGVGGVKILHRVGAPVQKLCQKPAGSARYESAQDARITPAATASAMITNNLQPLIGTCSGCGG
jgi:hypothetical protein